jgi:Rieske Fe-S protein
MKRRDFVQICAASAAGATLPRDALSATLQARLYRRAKLVDEQRQPIRIETLQTGANYVFDYPYEATPCFLLRLDRPVAGAVELRTETGEPYRWDGGIGAQRNVVAYSAICAHKLTYPTKVVSFIGYRHAPSPVAGPAPQPLATILLEHDARANEVYAVGTFGGEMFAEFFRKYDFRLQLEMGPRARAEVDGLSVVRPLESYSTQWAKC